MKKLVLLTLLVSTAALAAPNISSIAPSSGPISGGTVVTIRGTGFQICPICSPPSPPGVFFGYARSPSVQLIDATTLTVTTPPHFPGTTDIRVSQFGGDAIASQAFTYIGNVADAFEKILVPIYSRPIFGAFGSEFHTIARVGLDGHEFVSIYGVDTNCLLLDPPQLPENPFELPLEADFTLPSVCSAWPGRFFFVPKAQAASVIFNDRVLDVSRTGFSNGTEIPIVRSNRFTTGRLTFLGIPIDERYRNALRIYSTAPQTVLVRVAFQPAIPVQLQAGPTLFDPAYASFTDFPVGMATIRVTVEPAAVAAANPQPIWAFITVTNNDSQQITTITPDP